MQLLLGHAVGDQVLLAMAQLLSENTRSGDVVVRLTDAVATNGEFTLGPVTLTIGSGERVAIVGQEWETHGSSVLNFGFFCPVGQPTGPRLQAALASSNLNAEPR